MGCWTTNAALGARRMWTRNCFYAMGTTAGGIMLRRVCPRLSALYK